MTNLATTLIGSLCVLTAGVAGCTTPTAPEQKGGASSHIESGATGAMEFDLSKGKIDLSGGALTFCSNEAPEAAQLVEKVLANPDEYLVPYKDNTGAPLVITGADDRTNGVYVADLPTRGFDALCDGGGQAWRIPIHSAPGDLAAELGAAVKFVLERSFGGGGDGWSCTAGGELAFPFIEMHDDQWGVVDGNLVAPRIDVGFKGDVEAEVGFECSVKLGKIPTPYPWLELEIEAAAGVSTDVSGAINASISTKEQPSFQFPGKPDFTLSLSLKARAFKLLGVGVKFSVTTDDPQQLTHYDCSREVPLEIAATVTGGLDPELPLNLVNSYMLSLPVSTEFTIPPMCQGGAPEPADSNKQTARSYRTSTPGHA
jgi:hypothetical protein